MPSDPNAGLIRALDSFTRALKANSDVVSDNTKKTEALTKEIKNRLPRNLTFTNHPYLEPSSGARQQSSDAGEGPYGTSSAQPYDGEGSGKDLGYEGPYGSGPSSSR